MLGYLRIARARPEHWHHRCALCHTLGRGYSTRARLLAGDDPTLLLVLLEGLSEAPPPLARVRCPLPPFWRQRHAVDPSWPALPLVAAVQLFLVGEKLFDDRVDREGPVSAVAAWALSRDIATACESLAGWGLDLEAVRAILRQQADRERDPTSDLDALSEPTAVALGQLVGFCVGALGLAGADAARQFGDRLGRALYLVDALADLSRDRQGGRFNAVSGLVDALGRLARPYLEDVVAGRLRALQAGLGALPLKRHADLLHDGTVGLLGARAAQALRGVDA